MNTTVKAAHVKYLFQSVARAQLEMVGSILDDIARDWPAFHSVLMDSRAGWPASMGAANSGRSTEVADPTVRAALVPDTASRRLEEAATLVAALVAAARNLDAIRAEWTPRAVVSGLCQNEYGCPAGRKAAPGRRRRCESCYRFLLDHGVDRTSARVAS